MALADVADELSWVSDLLQGEKGHAVVAEALMDGNISTSEKSVRRYRSKIGWAPSEPEVSKAVSAEERPHATEENGALTIYHDSWPVKLDGETGYAPLLEFFGFDPEAWEVDGPVKVSKWQTSKGSESGGRDVIWLYSYKCRFKQRTGDAAIDVQDIEAVAAQVRAWEPRLHRLGLSLRGKAEPVTFVHQQGDEQTGKAEGNSLDGLWNRETEALERSMARLDHLMASGKNIECIFDSANGDGVENTFGHYNSQMRTTETLRKQIAFRRDMDIARTKAFCEYGIPIKKAYAKSNHGEMRQVVGSSPFSSESDNLDLIIAEMVKAVMDQTQFADQIEWYIPHDEDWTKINLSGVNVGTTHGHKADRRKQVDWLREQRDMLHFHEDWKMQLALFGHKHHGHIEEVSGTWLIQSPSLDGGSPYFSSFKGDRAQHGILTFLVGESIPHGFGELSFL
jgi:hypothetical protein